MEKDKNEIPKELQEKITEIGKFGVNLKINVPGLETLEKSIKNLNSNFVPIANQFANIKLPENFISTLTSLQQGFGDLGKLWLENYNRAKEGYSVERKKFKKDFKNIIKKEGLQLPNDFEEYFFWVGTINDNANFNEVVQLAKDPNTYKRFHEYRLRQLNNPGWNTTKEALYIEAEGKGKGNQFFIAKTSHTEQKNVIKFTAKEYALTYIFDLWAIGKQIPINRVEGGYRKKELYLIGETIPGIKPNTFYNAVKEVAKNNLNSRVLLQNISKDWYNAVRTLSKHWEVTEEYLRTIGLIEGKDGE